MAMLRDGHTALKVQTSTWVMSFDGKVRIGADGLHDFRSVGDSWLEFLLTLLLVHRFGVLLDSHEVRQARVVVLFSLGGQSRRFLLGWGGQTGLVASVAVEVGESL